MLAYALPAFSRRRMAGASAALALHGLIIFALLHLTTAPVPIEARVREILLQLTTPKKVLPPAHAAAKAGHKTRMPPYAIMHTLVAPTFPKAQDERRALAGFGFSLFACAPENLANLDAGGKARCARLAAEPQDGVDFHDHTDRAKSAVHWARGRDRKNAPPLLPCANPQTAMIGLGTLLCLGQGVADGGFDLDGAPGYADKPVIVHVPNGGDPPNGLPH